MGDHPPHLLWTPCIMDAQDVKALIEAGIENAEVVVKLEGNSCQLMVVSAAFEGLRILKKQQLIYACLNDKIASGELHAVTMHAYSPEEWDKKKVFGAPF